MTPLVRSVLHDGITTLTLDSPANRNALSLRLVQELRTTLLAALADPAVRVVVLTGAGPAFCSGADLKEQRQGLSPEQRALAPRLTVEVLTAMWESPKPIVGRINGPARAGGLGLIGACDLALAPLGATFAFPEVRLGVVPAVIAVTVVPRMDPRSAAELLLTGEVFDAARAAAAGLLTAAVPPDQLDAEVQRRCEALRLGAPGALGSTKRLLRRVGELPLRDAFAEMSDLSLAAFASEEGREGLAAAAERRRPGWADP